MTEYTELVYDGVVAETPEAVLLRIDAELHWIPRSQIDGDPDLDAPGRDTLDVSVWFATKEGLV